jgi:DNA-binding Lrp family transcriptional regulator
VAACPQIVQCDSTTGEADYTMTVLIADIKRYELFLHDTLFKLPGITHVRSRIVLKAVKSAGRLPLPGAGQAAAAPAVVRAQRRLRG